MQKHVLAICLSCDIGIAEGAAGQPLRRATPAGRKCVFEVIGDPQIFVLSGLDEWAFHQSHLLPQTQGFLELAKGGGKTEPESKGGGQRRGGLSCLGVLGDGTRRVEREELCGRGRDP